MSFAVTSASVNFDEELHLVSAKHFCPDFDCMKTQSWPSEDIGCLCNYANHDRCGTQISPSCEEYCGLAPCADTEVWEELELPHIHGTGNGKASYAGRVTLGDKKYYRYFHNSSCAIIRISLQAVSGRPFLVVSDQPDFSCQERYSSPYLNNFELCPPLHSLGTWYFYVAGNLKTTASFVLEIEELGEKLCTRSSSKLVVDPTYFCPQQLFLNKVDANEGEFIPTH
ncbi:hypothetical protein QOT17_015211 [Balamuthia mandrillaris]